MKERANKEAKNLAKTQENFQKAVDELKKDTDISDKANKEKHGEEKKLQEIDTKEKKANKELEKKSKSIAQREQAVQDTLSMAQNQNDEDKVEKSQKQLSQILEEKEKATTELKTLLGELEHQHHMVSLKKEEALKAENKT
jgi:hypothetical protein